MINLTKTKGQNQFLEDIFAAIEDIEDGFIIDTIYDTVSMLRLYLSRY